MVLVVELCGKLKRKGLSPRSNFLEDIHNEIRKVIQPIEFLFHGITRRRDKDIIPVIPDFLNEKGIISYLRSIILHFIY